MRKIKLALALLTIAAAIATTAAAVQEMSVEEDCPSEKTINGKTCTLEAVTTHPNPNGGTFKICHYDCPGELAQ
jgi:hypothetical protein